MRALWAPIRDTTGHRACPACLAVILCTGALASCSGSKASGIDPEPQRSAPTVQSDIETSRARTIRLSGTLDAVRATRIVVPQVAGPVQRMTLTRLIPSGAQVAQGDIVAEFDPLEQIDLARQSAARYEDLSYQVRQRQADNAANTERRRSEREQAEAELAKALLEVSKAPVLSETDAEKNEIRAATARTRLDSLARTHAEQARADRAALRALELQRDRQKAAHDRAQANLEQLRVRAPIAGTVAHAMFFSNSAMVRPQVGDQMMRSSTLMNIFDPAEMLVRVQVAEPDGALLQPGLEGTVLVDAYPDLDLRASLVTSSPVAAFPGLGRGIKTFMAVFRLIDTDPRLMPDLSAAVVFEAHDAPAGDRAHEALPRAVERVVWPGGVAPAGGPR